MTNEDRHVTPAGANVMPTAGTAGWRQRVLRALPVTAVLLVIAAGLVLALLDHWRRGSALLAAAAALAALLRLVLPTRMAGVLAVRTRRFDVAFLILLTALLVAMALAVTDPRNG